MRGKSNKTGQGVTVLSNSQVAAQATNIFIFPTASSTSSSAEISKEYVPSRTTVYRQRKRLQEGTTKAVHKHPSVPYTCSKCTQDRTAATGHYGYRGWFCPLTKKCTLEEWIQTVKTKFSKV